MYFPNATPGMLGTAMIWAGANDCSAIHLIVDEGEGALAHAATMFAEPTPQVWKATGRSLTPAIPAAPPIPAPPECVSLTADLAAAGLDVVADHGVWLGEINGLEVARVGVRAGECAMDIGVGAYDQFASAALNLDRDDNEALAGVVEMVRPHRIAGAAPHPIGRLVRSRWLRAQVVRNPASIGLDLLNPVPLLRERPGLMETQPAAALGERDGSPVLAVFTVGLDLGIAETAAGLAATFGADRGVDEIRVIVPTRDKHQRIVDAVDSLRLPAQVIAIDGEWTS